MEQKKEENRIQSFAQNKTILFILFVMFVAVVTSLIRNIFADLYGTTMEKQFIIIAASDILVSVLIVLPVMVKLDVIERIGLCRKRGIGRGLLLGSIDLIGSIIYTYITFLGVYKFQYQYAGLGMIFSVVLFGFATGVMEEFGIRGVLLPILIQKWGGTKNAVIKAVWTTSIVFGLLHGIDLISYFIKNGSLSSEYIIVKLFHILYTVMFGVFAGALVVYTKSIWGIIVIHALHDIISSVEFVIVKPLVAGQLSFANGMETLVGANSFLSSGYASIVFACIFEIPAFCVGIILLKKYKTE